MTNKWNLSLLVFPDTFQDISVISGNYGVLYIGGKFSNLTGNNDQNIVKFNLNVS